MEINSEKIKLSIVVPVYNEEEIIIQVINDLKKALSQLNLEYEIIAVNDGSSDKSGEILETIREIKIINHPYNRGYGASLKTGIKNSKYDWILIIDADGTYPTESISKLIEKTREYDLVIGSREGKNVAIPIERKYAKRFLNKFASYLAGRKIPDLNSGLRLFRKDIVFKYWDLFPDRFSFTSTLTMVCLTHGYETAFVPISYNKRSGKSSLRPTAFFSFLKLVIKLSLFFRPIRVFGPISLFILMGAVFVAVAFFIGITPKFLDTTFVVLCATALQTFFFGLLAEIIAYNK
ncbi:MAG: glycosyl transferase family protein [Parcubacteria group bacterium Athens0714_24]|nr:MAG: glycosyl transferase family protein [Parcubacteria group bacterium Athens0714_24]